MTFNHPIGVSDALESLIPGAKWTVGNNNYSQLQWLDENKGCPSKEQIETEIKRLQEEYEAKEYQRLREKEYPSFADQFDLLYHGGYDAWKVEIDKVKDKYPKPE